MTCNAHPALNALTHVPAAGLVYACGCLVGTEQPQLSAALNMGLIAVGVVVCALGEVNLVAAGLVQQLIALGFEVRLQVTETAVLCNQSSWVVTMLLFAEGCD